MTFFTRRHRHACRCSRAVLVCSQPIDQCRVVEPWECDTCREEQLDAWAEDINSTRTQPATKQEPNR